MEVPTSPNEQGLFTRLRPDDLLVVGLGASAGGIQALSRFFEHVPSDSGMAYVVILHLSPEHDSQLAQVLQNTASIPVTQVTERVLIQPNHVYVIPPNQHLEMDEEYITVTPNLLVEDRRAPVDIFFRTLAESHQARAVAVILSGTGANGSMGLKRIKERGGLTFAQNPREAEFNEMPRNAIATELVDEVLSAGEIPGHILNYRASLGLVEIPVEPENRPDDQQKALREIFTQLRLRTGHDFSNYKRPTVLRRIERRVNVRRLPNLPSYAAYLSENPDEVQALLKDLLISVTNFFRDQRAFEVLEQEVIPRVVNDKAPGDQVRVWVAGCATGEEAYTVAMLFAERTLGEIEAPKIQIFATDIDEAAIATAREGLYTLNDAADVSPERLRRFFTPEGEEYRVRREIREMVLFAHHNVLKDPPFSHVDWITCRNLLIYLNNTAQERVMETFHFALKPGGFLFLGASESVEGATDLYATVNREQHVFQSRQTGSRLYPTPEASGTFRFEKTRIGELQSPPESAPLERISFGELHQQMLEQYAPPSIVVNEAFDIVHLSERAGRYLHVAGGEPTNNLLKMIRPELRLDLRTALYRAVQHNTNVETRAMEIHSAERTENITIRVRPVLRQTDTARGFLLIVFEPSETTGERPSTLVTGDEPVARQLEEELVRAKEQLRTVSEQYEAQTEELRASNEELQAMNEELRSTAEELETSQEELQSINEELRTVNQELKVKVDEITYTNNNFRNLINSTSIGTIFLDRGFRVNLYTPAVTELFNLLPSDIGRPISDITNRLMNTDLVADAESVLNKLQVIEREVPTSDGRTFLMRVLPYRTEMDRINGVVVTFVDIAHRKQAEDQLRQSEVKYRTLFELVPIAVTLTDRDGVIQEYNRPAVELWGREPVRGAPQEKYCGSARAYDRKGNLVRHDQLPVARLLRGEPVEAKVHELVIEQVNGTRHNVVVMVGLLRDEQGAITGAINCQYDVTELQHTREALRESQEYLRLALDSVTDYSIITHDAEGTITGWNPGAESMFGYSADEAIGKNSALIFTPEDRAALVHEEEMRVARETGRAADERYHLRKDGTRFWMSGVMTALFDGARLNGYVKIAHDLTEERKVEATVRESEARFRTLANAVPQVVWTNEANGRATYFNQRWFDFTGLSLEESTGPGWQNIVHPDDAEAAINLWKLSLASGTIFDIEYRLRGADGHYRWFIGRNVPLHDADGRIIGWFGTATDIEDIKRAEVELQRAHDELESRVQERTVELTRALEQLQSEVMQRRQVEADRAALIKRIVVTQEEERGRISRELHDNLGQHLTAVMLGLQALENQVNAISGGNRKQETPQLEKLRTLVDGLMRAAHRQSKELRPAELDAMGVAAALQQYITDWSEMTEVPVDYTAIGWEGKRLDTAIETTLYRVVQEALTNVARHANASQVGVILELSPDTASVIIEDNGRGFDPRQSQSRLGLLGMRERLAIVGGTLNIESSPEEGTTVFARISLQGAGE